MHRFCLIVIALLIAPTLVSAQQKTPWGDPDLQGVWSNQSPTPLERPAALAGKATLSEAEAAEFERTSLERLLTDLCPRGADQRRAQRDLARDRERQSASEPEHLAGRGPTGRQDPLHTGRQEAMGREAEDRAADAGQCPRGPVEAERCLTTDGLLVPNPFYNNYFQIVQAPGHVAIVTEMMHEHRVIPLDQRPRVGSGVQMWVGRFARVVGRRDTGRRDHEFQRQEAFFGATSQLHLVERFTRLDADTIEYRLTVTDPATFARPWTLVNGLWRADDGIYEVGCHEGNIGLRGILAGARAQETK